MPAGAPERGMARGFESKSVADQQEATFNPRPSGERIRARSSEPGRTDRRRRRLGAPPASRCPELQQASRHRRADPAARQPLGWCRSRAALAPATGVHHPLQQRGLYLERPGRWSLPGWPGRRRARKSATERAHRVSSQLRTASWLPARHPIVDREDRLVDQRIRRGGTNPGKSFTPPASCPEPRQSITARGLVGMPPRMTSTTPARHRLS